MQENMDNLQFLISIFTLSAEIRELLEGLNDITEVDDIFRMDHDLKVLIRHIHNL